VRLLCTLVFFLKKNEPACTAIKERRLVLCRMCAFVCVYTHTQTHGDTHTYVYTYTHKYMHKYIHNIHTNICPAERNRPHITSIIHNKRRTPHTRTRTHTLYTHTHTHTHTHV
jgi:Fe-S-cluster containining protein